MNFSLSEYGMLFKAMDNIKRRKILKCINENPGVLPYRLTILSRLSRSTVQHQLKVLVSAQLIIFESSMEGYHYYVNKELYNEVIKLDSRKNLLNNYR